MILAHAQRRRWRGLGQIPTAIDVASPTFATGSPGSVIPVSGIPQPPAQDAADCASGFGLWNFFFDRPAYESCVASAIASGPASVVGNAQQFYGVNSPAAIAAETAASQQASFAPSDAGTIADFYGAGSVNPLFTPGAQPSTAGIPTWVWWLGGGVVALVALKAVLS